MTRGQAGLITVVGMVLTTVGTWKLMSGAPGPTWALLAPGLAAFVYGGVMMDVLHRRSKGKGQ
ncbi:hypothetical protein [Pseudoprimorskyibacter insulae]|uniref:Uncharacterized protein n=1 Tax=Pseudoprimorskyibacter insulae TaxID=1695997 RepID=A0A2R8AX94_9RHOB|nr:hypothetical protein [Pseudoprimorskyibacter insulae]SPF80509.1 hypothetical protein PRI8871_02319 [Pseudoprimorskyibacter insulae]